MDYASVIVTFNRKEKLIKALQSLLNQTMPPQQIFIVDNNSTDGTFDLLKREKFLDNPTIKYKKLSRNIGGSGGFYSAIKWALQEKGFDYISISDDDAVYNDNYFELIEKAQKSNPKIKAFCGTVKDLEGNIQLDHRRKISNKKSLESVPFSVSSYNGHFLVDEFSFVGCVINVEIIKQIGLPKKEYFIYYDDTEYSLRVRKYTNVMNISEAVIHHLVVPTKKDNIELGWKNYYEIRNKILMDREYSSWKLINVYLFYKQLRLVCHIIRDYRFRGMRWRSIKVYNDGFIDGMLGKTGKNIKYLPNNNMLK